MLFQQLQGSRAKIIYPSRIVGVGRTLIELLGILALIFFCFGRKLKKKNVRRETPN